MPDVTVSSRDNHISLPCTPCVPGAQVLPGALPRQREAPARTTPSSGSMTLAGKSASSSGTVAARATTTVSTTEMSAKRNASPLRLLPRKTQVMMEKPAIDPLPPPPSHQQKLVNVFERSKRRGQNCVHVI